MKGRYIPVAIFVLAGLALLFLPLPAVVKSLLYKTYNLVLFCYILYLVAAPAVRDLFVERKKQIERTSSRLGQPKSKLKRCSAVMRKRSGILNRRRPGFLHGIKRRAPYSGT